jgi:hypothetical protein
VSPAMHRKSDPDTPMKLRARWLFISLHALLWLALAGGAYATAGPYQFASCWQIIPIYLPPIGILLLALAASSLLVMMAALARPSLRNRPVFLFACHGLILTGGMICCSLAAHAATGPVSCL